MAKKNAREEPPKPTVAENAQMSDIVFILDKMELLLKAVSEIGQDGKFKTVDADKRHRNSFLKIDRYADIFENFIKNFWSQFKDPTRFGILSVREGSLDSPEVQQAIEDMANGKKTEAVEEFLKKYEIVPRNKENQSINPQNQEEMAKKEENQPQVAAEGGQQQNPYRYNESMINWEQLKNFGLSREYLQERGLLDQMLRGYKTNQVVPITMNFGSAALRTDARLSFQQSRNGEIVLGIHGIRQKPDLDRPYFGHIFSDEDKRNLLETGNMGRVVELKGRNGEYIPSFISIDRLTNEVVATKVDNVFIPNEIKGVELTEQEKNDLSQIERHTLDPDAFMASIRDYTRKATGEILRLSLPAAPVRTFTCPKCKTGHVILKGRTAKCDNEGCGLLVFRKFLNKELTDQHLEQLFSSGTTRLIKGFKGKKGVAFDAAVAFDAGFNLVLSFPKDGKGRKRK